ncbi:hypothetical protein F3Y22_tig00110893pilonHSYRG00346 [Hibiscus syriacus]|uniref:BES1/BZR1 plant transcription factor N-terminal domain-containing protein n=1 Tax=Hibiscus syriacus TaxID=106335 RepID=A0A6A2ZGM2_HIBSY|nr:hypothetical protein F3Y22_tig00110893pilonHSYRG00346 [Hibiscus syriacus]
MNDVLSALECEAGWTVEADGTTYRQSPTPQNQQNVRVNSARSGDSPLSTRRLKNCSAKATLDCQPPVVRIDDNERFPPQGGNLRTEKSLPAEAAPALSEADVDHHGIKESTTKGYSNGKPSEVARRRRTDFNIGGRKVIQMVVMGVEVDASRYSLRTYRRRSIGRDSNLYFAPMVMLLMPSFLSKGIRQESSTVVQSKSGMEDYPRIKHCEVEGVVDEDKLQVLSNCLVGWCMNFIKIGNLANQIQAKGLAGFTLMRAVGNVVLMVFENSDSLRSVKDDKLKTLAEWFSRVETWSDSLVVECRLVWLVCEGIPFHTWNWDTFKNIATKWGKLMVIDNSCEFPSSFDWAKIQKLTNVHGKIDEMLELKVGDNLFKILVYEVDPSFKPNSWVPEDCDISLDLVPQIGS